LEAVNETGRVFLSHTKLRGKFGIRFAIGNLKTTWEDVSEGWEVVRQKAEELSQP
jgi:aromatic-L-amino-acid decarboxylase